MIFNIIDLPALCQEIVSRIIGCASEAWLTEKELDSALVDGCTQLAVWITRWLTTRVAGEIQVYPLALARLS